MTRIASYPNPLLRGRRLPEGVQAPGPFYRFSRRLAQVGFSALWHVRVFNRHYEPASDGVVYICNHQSFLDPVLMSLALRRPMNYMARDSLFGFGPFRLLIEALNALPVRRGAADLAALKGASRRIRNGGQVVVFAEGTRTPDGRIGPMLPGVAALAQRAAQWTVPVLIDGAFEAWPRTSMLPGLGNIAVQYARPIRRAEARGFSAHELVAHVRGQLIDMQTELRGRLGREPFRYDD